MDIEVVNLDEEDVEIVVIPESEPDADIPQQREPTMQGPLNFLKTFLQTMVVNPDVEFIKRTVNAFGQRDVSTIYYELCAVDINKLPKVQGAVLQSCLKAALMRWDGYFDAELQQLSIDEAYTELCKHLEYNLNHVKKVYPSLEEKYLSTERISHNSNIVEMVCPYRQLKALVYHDLNPETNSVINFSMEPKARRASSHCVDLFRDIFNVPFIEIKITSPLFTFTRQNTHNAEYKLVRLTPEYKPTIKQLDTRVRFARPVGKKVESFPTQFIKDFLSQFKSAIRTDTSHSAGKKMDMLGMLSEFSHEVRKCGDVIECGSDYFAYLNKYPYVRYLGRKTDGNAQSIIDYEEQIKLEKDSMNLRLQEMVSPYVKFSLAKFNISYYKENDDKIKFDIQPNFVASVLNKYAAFNCILCNFERIGPMAKYEIETHIFEEHGDEPNWYCLKCKAQMSMKVLCMDRWTHQCPYIKRKVDAKRKIAKDEK